MGITLKFFYYLFLSPILFCASAACFCFWGACRVLLWLINAVEFLARTTASIVRRIWALICAAVKGIPSALHRAGKSIKLAWEFTLGATALLLGLAMAAGGLYLVVYLVMTIFRHPGAVLEFLLFLLP